MEGVISNFRRSRHHQYNNHLIIVVQGVESREKAKKLVNKQVSWKSPADKEIKGLVKAAHGNKGAVRVIFERALPGQAVSQKVLLK